MRKKQIVIVFIILLLFPTVLFAQRKGLLSDKDRYNASLVFSLGPSYCFGDLGGSVKPNPTPLDDFAWKNLRYAFSAGFRQSFNRFSYRVSLHQGLYASTDKDSRYAYRGYESTSNVMELTTLAELDVVQGFIGINPYRLYAFGGGGLAYAAVDMTGSKASAPNVFQTSDFTPVIPFGFGFDMWISSKWNLGLEMAWQYAFSDFMDGVKTGGNDAQNDILANLSFTLSYKILGRNAHDKYSRCNCWKD